jgi:arylsulfatase A-like enzyme
MPHREPPPDVLLITIDTLRSDALRPEDTPALLELAARGRRFTNARTPVPLTLPAHATMLSGLSPRGHGLRDNTARPLAPRDTRGFHLIPEQFQDRGFVTAAFVGSAVLDPRYKLDAGFDVYRHPAPPKQGALVWDTLDASEQVKRFLDWHGSRPKDRHWFAWVHLWDPHDPYRPYAGDARRAGTAETDPAGERYRGEVRRADAALEAILAGIDLEKTVVVVCSDHGESLGAHDERTHGYLCYGATMNVPLIVAGPGIESGEDATPCTLEDLAPTLREICGLAAKPGDGRDLFDEEQTADRVVAGESLYAYRLFVWAQQQVAFDGRYSLVDGGPSLELFDLTEDPGETRPVADPQRHPAFERLDRTLMEYRSADGREEEGGALTPYGTPYGSKRIAGNALLPVAENRALRAVRPGLATVELLDRFRGLIGMRHAGAVRALLPEISEAERADPSNPALALHRGRALLLVLSEPQRAAEALERARALGYDDPDVWRLLLRAYESAGDSDAASSIRALLAGKKRDR